MREAPEDDVASSNFVKVVVEVAEHLLNPGKSSLAIVENLYKDMKLTLFDLLYETVYSPLQLMRRNPWIHSSPSILPSLRGHMHKDEYE